MNYIYKITTHGRAVMAACMALEKPLKITRIAFGSGKVSEEINLADVHELLEYVSDGAVTERRHEADRLFLTIQYANQEHPDVKKMFLLSEFMLFTEDPESGTETDLMYGTLGDYRQPVPAYHPAFSPSVFSFPLVLVISDEVHVDVSAPVGIATYYDLEAMAKEFAIRCVEFAIPSAGWTADVIGKYKFRLDMPVDGVIGRMIPQVTVLPAGESAAVACGLCPVAETVEGAVRFRAVDPPSEDIPAALTLLRDSTGVIFSYDTSITAELPVASETQAGVVKVKPGSGFVIDKEGNLGLDTATPKEVLDLFNGSNG